MNAKLEEIFGEEFLSDSLHIEGTEPSKFFEAMELLDSLTEHEVYPLNGIIVCSPADFRPDEIKYDAHYLTGVKGKKLTYSKLLTDEVEYLFPEIIGERQCLLIPEINSNFYLCRTLGLVELMIALGLRGTAPTEQSEARDYYIAELLRNAPSKKKVTLVTRKQSKSSSRKKILSIRTDKYEPIPLTEVKTVFDKIAGYDMGKIVCKGWFIDHDYAAIDFEFPERTEEFLQVYGMKHNVVPGLRLYTSGTGYSCFTAMETWRVGSVTSIHRKVKQKHIGDWDPDLFINEISKKIFDKYATLPTRLCDLFEVTLLTTDQVVNENGRVLSSNISKVILTNLEKVFTEIKLAESFKMGLDLQKKRKNYLKELAEHILTHYQTEIQKALQDAEKSGKKFEYELTAYDLAMEVMMLPENFKDVSKSYYSAFANACGQAAYCEYLTGEKILSNKAASFSIVA